MALGMYSVSYSPRSRDLGIEMQQMLKGVGIPEASIRPKYPYIRDATSKFEWTMESVLGDRLAKNISKATFDKFTIVVMRAANTFGAGSQTFAPAIALPGITFYSGKGLRRTVIKSTTPISTPAPTPVPQPAPSNGGGMELVMPRAPIYIGHSSESKAQDAGLEDFMPWWNRIGSQIPKPTVKPGGFLEPFTWAYQEYRNRQGSQAKDLARGAWVAAGKETYSVRTPGQMFLPWFAEQTGFGISAVTDFDKAFLIYRGAAGRQDYQVSKEQWAAKAAGPSIVPPTGAAPATGAPATGGVGIASRIGSFLMPGRDLPGHAFASTNGKTGGMMTTTRAGAPQAAGAAAGAMDFIKSPLGIGVAVVSGIALVGSMVALGRRR